MDEIEPNNDFATAQKINPGDVVSAAMESDEPKSDYFVLTIPPGKQDGMLEIVTEEADDELSLHVEIFDSNRKSLTSQHSMDKTEKVVTTPLEASAGAMYYVHVERYFSTIPAGTSVPYTLTSKFTRVADPGERNDDFTSATPVALGSDVKFAIFAGVDTNGGEDKDFFKVELPAGKSQLSIKVTNTSTAQSPQGLDIELFDGTKKSLSSVGGEKQQDITKTFDSLEPGTYYLAAQRRFSGNSTALHTIAVTAN